MDYGNLSDEIKNKMFDIRLKEINTSPYQENFRYIISRDFWINTNIDDKLEYYYKIANKQSRKVKIIKIIKKI